MDTVTLTQQNRLFWLGRYAERLCTMIQYRIELFDHVLCGEEIDYGEICRRLGIPNVYTDGENFIRAYTFDAASPYSLRSAAEYMLGNGMVLRETISTPTLAYLQMARDQLVSGEKSDVVALCLQKTLDNIMAFRGSFDDYVEQESVRNLIKSGRSVERLSLMLRLGWRLDTLIKELRKLYSRQNRTGLVPCEQSLELVRRALEAPETVSLESLLSAVENFYEL